MARYRKCPRSCAQGKSCKWIHKMLQQVPPLKCPYFLKNVSTFMLWQPRNPCPRLEVPADFVQAHDDKFNETVEVRGPCKSTWRMRVNVLVCKHRRVMFDHGWRAFVNELALQRGDHLLFVLTAFSKFKVYVFDENGIRKRSNSIFIEREREPAFSMKQSCIWPTESYQEAPSELWKRKLRDRGSLAGPLVVDLSDDLQEDNGSEELWEEREVQSEEASSSQILRPKKPPHFIKRVPAISLRNESGTHLEVPVTFTQRYDGLFKECVALQGPTGRIWKVMCQKSEQQQYRRVRLREGWVDFAEDNMLKLHDQLLFTHKADGQFLVQIVPKGHRRRGRPRLYRPEYIPSTTGRQEHEDGARMNPVDTPEEPVTPMQWADVNKDPLKSRIYQLQQQLLVQRRTVQRRLENRCASRRGRMEWGLGHS